MPAVALLETPITRSAREARRTYWTGSLNAKRAKIARGRAPAGLTSVRNYSGVKLLGAATTQRWCPARGDASLFGQHCWRGGQRPKQRDVAIQQRDIERLAL